MANTRFDTKKPKRGAINTVVRFGGRHTGRLIKHTAKKGHHHRVKLVPVYVGLVSWLVSGVLYLVPDGWKTAFLPVAIAAVVLFLYGRHRRNEVPTRPIPLRHYLYLWVSWAGASAWFVVASRFSPLAQPLSGVLVIGVIAAGLPYWWHRWGHKPKVVVKDEKREVRIEDVDAEIALWVKKVEHKVLPGAELAGFARLPDGNGWESPLKFTNDEIGIEEAFERQLRLSRIFDVPLPNIALRAAADGRPSGGHITVMERNPLAEPTLWKGPSLTEDGVIRVGSHTDGREAKLRFWRKDSGGVHMLLAGCTDSGKSRVTDMLLAEERHSPLIASFVIDPQGGQSLPAWKKATAEFAVSAADGTDLLEHAVDIMYCRNKAMANEIWYDAKGREREGRDFFEPTPERPLISITVDEAQVVLSDPRAVVAAERLAGMARKCGLTLRLITQLPLLAQLGNSMYLRGQVAAGTVIVLRTAERLSSQVAFNGALPGADPCQLPREWPDGTTTAGLGYLLGATSHPGMFRADFLNRENVYDWATTGETTRVDVESIPKAGQKGLHLVKDDVPTPMTDAQIWQSGKARERILAFLGASGTSHRTTAIAMACQIDKSTASNTLTELSNSGVIVQHGRGEWQHADNSLQASSR
jgi:hypothetical protein